MWRWGCLSAPPRSAGTLLLWHFLGSRLFDYSDCDGLFGPEVCFKSHQEHCLSKDQSIMRKVPYYAKFTMPIFASNNRCRWLVGELGGREDGLAFISFCALHCLRSVCSDNWFSVMSQRAATPLAARVALWPPRARFVLANTASFSDRGSVDCFNRVLEGDLLLVSGFTAQIWWCFTSGNEE